VSQSAINESDANWQNALDIIIPNFSISAHNKELFRNASLNIVHGRKYGFVGPNGAGKSTLLKMIASGDLKIPPRIDALYVEQEVVPDDTPAVQAVLRADTRRFALQDEQQRLEERLEQEEDIDEAVLDRLAEIHDQLSSMGADAAEAHARRILFGLGFDAEMQDQPTKAFSGGWRMRISLAKALYLEPTLLMLDEPTNHLDLNAVIWLDDYLSKWKKTLLIVSHDQDFLNSVCEEILHLNAKKIDAYRGNYDQFKEMELQKRKQQQVAWEKQQKKIRALKQSGKSKAQAEATAKSKYRESGGAKKNKKQSDAIAVGSQNAETVELIERPREYVVHFEFPEVPQLSPPIISVNDVAFRYGSKGKWIFKDINFGLDMDSRICIVGPNGAGKSTLLKLVTGALQPTTGEINVNPRLRMGIYNQHFIDRVNAKHVGACQCV
jgi:ATP-binding cassette subfamily F protein 1